MRETRQSGSEGGVAFRAIPTPIFDFLNPRWIGARRLPVLRSSTAEGGRRFNMEKRAFPNSHVSMNFDREAA